MATKSQVEPPGKVPPDHVQPQEEQQGVPPVSVPRSSVPSGGPPSGARPLPGNPGGSLGRARMTIAMQRAVGNRRTGQFLHAAQFQLAVNQPGDAAEQEAERVSEHAVQPPNGPPAAVEVRQRPVQASTADGPSPQVTAGTERVIGAAQGGGQPLAETTRQHMESRLGADFRSVRVHLDATSAGAADDFNARAFTSGRDIFFAAGQYQPGTTEGQKLLAHELTHTIQQENAPGDVQRQPVEPEALVDSPAYYEEFKASIWYDILEPFSSTALYPGSPYAYWLWGRNDSFIYSTFVPLSTQPWAKLAAAAQPSSADAAIRRGRDADREGRGPREYRREVADEIRALFLPRVQQSLFRLAPQFVAAGYLTMKREVPPGETLSLGSRQPVPDARLLTASHPLDHYAIVGLIGHTDISQLQVDYQRYVADGQAAQAELQLKKVRPVKFTWEADAGTWLWVRVTDPPGASAEEVANELYGDSAMAGSILPASPLFGFDPKLLVPAHFQAWKAVAGDLATATTALNTSYSAASDPYKNIVRAGNVPPLMDPAVEMLRSRSSGQAALNQARGLPPTGDSRDKIIARLRVSVALMEQIVAEASVVGGRWYTGALVKAKIEERIVHLSGSTDGIEAVRWDAHSQEENQILKAVANATKTAADQYRAFNVPFNQRGEKDLPSYIREPLLAVVTAYTEVADVAEFVDTARQRLAIAEEKSRYYPIEVLEGILAYCRDLLKGEKRGVGGEPDEFGQKALHDREKQLREKLYQAREMVLRDPARVQGLLAEIQVDVGDLQDQATMVSAMDSLFRLWHRLREMRGFIGEFTGKNKLYDKSVEVLNKWYFLIYPIYLGYQAEYPEIRAEARLKMRELGAHMGEMQEALDTIISLAETEEEREGWITLVLKIGAVVGIGLLTAGVGAYVSEGLLVGAGWGLTTEGVIGAAVLSSGAEAATFTALSTGILGRDPNQSLLSTFLENWALFGALKGLSFGLEATIGQKFAIFAAGHGGNITAGLAAQIGYTLVRQNAEARQRTGRPLNDEEKQAIVGESVVVFIATALLARYGPGRLFLEGSAARGEQRFRNSFLAADRTRLAAMDAARAASRTPTTDQAKNALTRDSEALQKEIDVLREMEDWARANPPNAKLLNIDPAQLAEIRNVNRGQLDFRERTSIALELTHEGGSLYRCENGKLGSIADRYRALGDRVSDPRAEAGGKTITVVTTPGDTLIIREAVPAERGPYADFEVDPQNPEVVRLFEQFEINSPAARNMMLRDIAYRRSERPAEQLGSVLDRLRTNLERNRGLANRNGKSLEEFLLQVDQVTQSAIAEALRSRDRLTALMLETSEQQGATLRGLDFSLKTQESLARKIADRLKPAVIKREGLDGAIAAAAREVNDVVRFTMELPFDRYMASLDVVKGRLAAEGYQQARPDFNAWQLVGTSREMGYRGINSTFRTPEGMLFEVQFHTPDSYAAKQESHPFYEVERSADSTRAEQAEAKRESLRIWRGVPVPEGAGRK